MGMIEMADALDVVVENRKAVEAKPGRVGHCVWPGWPSARPTRLVLEVEPGAIGRVHVLARAYVSEVVIAVEVFAVGGYVVEDAVEDYLYAVAACVSCEAVPIALGAEEGVDVEVILGVVGVIGCR